MFRNGKGVGGFAGHPEHNLLISFGLEAAPAGHPDIEIIGFLGGMVEHWGDVSNHWDAFFAELERWEDVLNQRADLPLDDVSDPPEPPD